MTAPTGTQLVSYGMTLRGTYGPPENVNKFTKAYYGDHTSASWCLIFVWYCLDHFDAAGLIGGKIAYVPNLKKRASGKWHTSKSLIAKGDPVTFDFNKTGEPEHIGIFVKWQDSAHTRFTSLEGNTTSRGSDDAVALKTRHWADVYGYVKPGLAPDDPSKYTGTIYRYISGKPRQASAHIKWIQERLNAAGAKPKLTTNGRYTKATATAVRAFQKAHGLKEDGEVGTKTWAALATGPPTSAKPSRRPALPLVPRLNAGPPSPQNPASTRGFLMAPQSRIPRRHMKIFGYEPTAILYAVNASVALFVAFGLPMTQTQVAAITTIATAVLTIATAAMTRPVVVSTITGAAATILTAIAAFGLHLTTNQTGAAVTALSIVLALLLRQHVSPAPALVRRRA